MGRRFHGALTVVLIASLLPSFSVAASLQSQSNDTDAEYDELLEFAVGSGDEAGDIDAFWRGLFERLESDSTYESPARLLAYDADRIPTSDCHLDSPVNNAFYCPADHVLAWDDTWLRRLHQMEDLDFAPLAILAHEWGHHIQSLLGSRVTELAAELQADCYASLYMTDAAQRGILTADDLGHGLMNLFSLGNLAFDSQDWFSPTEHGTPGLRMLAVQAGTATGALNSALETDDRRGWKTDLFYCRDYEVESFQPSRVARVGPFAINQFPNSEIHTLEGGSLEMVHQFATTRIEFHPGLVFASTASQFDRVRDAYFDTDSGETTRLIGEPQALQLASGRTGLVQAYERPVTQYTKTTTRHGIVFLDVVPGVGGILYDVFRQGPAPNDGIDWHPFYIHLLALLFATCSPDATGLSGCLFSELSWIELPEVTVTSSRDGIYLHLETRVLDPGPTLFTFLNQEMIDYRADGTLPVATAFYLVQLTEDLIIKPAEPPENLNAVAPTPDWLYDATVLGGPFTLNEFSQSQVVVDLTPGEWVVVGYPFMTPVSPPFTVRDSDVVTQSVEPQLGADIVLDDARISGFEEIGPGHQLWRITNVGEEPHEIRVYRFPDGTPPEEIVEWAEYWGSPSATDPPSDLSFNPDTDVEFGGFLLAAMSSDQSVLVELANLLPGTYAAICFVPHENTETPHAMLGEVAVFTVGNWLERE